MIVRDYFSCQTCGHPHCLRIYVGANNFQKHAFNCRNCGEMIEVGMHVNYRTVSTEMAAISSVGSPFHKDASIVTLHPEMVVPDDLQGKEYAFPFYSSHIASLRKTRPSRKNSKEMRPPDTNPLKNGKRADGYPLAPFMTGSLQSVSGLFF